MTDPTPWQRWRNLSFAAGAAVAVLFAAWDLYKWVEAYVSDHFHNDFTFYVAAARIGASRGWPSIYDLSIQQTELDASRHVGPRCRRDRWRQSAERFARSRERA